MNILFEQEELRLMPKQGSFDVEKVAQGIAGIGFSFRDTIQPKWFAVCEDEESRAEIQQQRQENPELGFPHVLMIQVEPPSIIIYQAAGEEFAPLAQEFLAWMSANYPCEVYNEEDEDLTAELPEAVKSGAAE